MEEVKLTDLKEHPFFRNMLIFNANRSMELFYSAIAEGKTVHDNPVLQLLDAMIERDAFHSTLPENLCLYRARSITTAEHFRKGISQKEDGTFSGFDESNSVEAPLHSTQSARANIKGMSYLYLAEDPYTACAEIRPVNNSFVSLATFKLLKPAFIIDLKTNQAVSEFSDIEEDLQCSVAEMITNIMFRFATPAIDDSIYASTQFISDYFRKAGFDGIRFQSAMSGGTNITLFNSHHSRIQFQSSRVLAVHSQHLNIMDLDNGETISSPVEHVMDEEYYSRSCKELADIIDRVNRRLSEEKAESEEKRTIEAFQEKMIYGCPYQQTCKSER